MSIMDELRRMLDERGVEWAEYGDGYTLLRHDGREYTVQPNVCDRLIVTNLTPEQAIAATLGSCNCSDNCTNSERTDGTCRLPETRIDHGSIEYSGVTEWRKCSACGKEVLAYPAHFCPNCGRKVVDE